MDANRRPMTFRWTAMLALASALAAAGCASNPHGGVLPETLQMSRFAPDTTPPACPNQKTTKQYASVKETFATTGGTICIPAFGGLGGSVAYPPAHPSTSVSLIASTTNYNHKLPSLHSGSPMFYLQLAIAGGTTFGSKVKVGGGLMGKPIVAGKSYTAYAQAKIYGFPVNFGPCYAVAKKGKYGGTIGGVGSLLKGQSVPGGVSGVIEIYSGKFTGTKC